MSLCETISNKTPQVVPLRKDVLLADMDFRKKNLNKRTNMNYHYLKDDM